MRRTKCEISGGPWRRSWGRLCTTFPIPRRSFSRTGAQGDNEQLRGLRLPHRRHLHAGAGDGDGRRRCVSKRIAAPEKMDDFRWAVQCAFLGRSCEDSSSWCRRLACNQSRRAACTTRAPVLRSPDPLSRRLRRDEVRRRLKKVRAEPPVGARPLSVALACGCTAGTLEVFLAAHLATLFRIDASPSKPACTATASATLTASPARARWPGGLAGMGGPRPATRPSPDRRLVAGLAARPPGVLRWPGGAVSGRRGAGRGGRPRRRLSADAAAAARGVRTWLDLLRIRDAPPRRPVGLASRWPAGRTCGSSIRGASISFRRRPNAWMSRAISFRAFRTARPTPRRSRRCWPRCCVPPPRKRASSPTWTTPSGAACSARPAPTAFPGASTAIATPTPFISRCFRRWPIPASSWPWPAKTTRRGWKRRCGARTCFCNGIASSPWKSHWGPKSESVGHILRAWNVGADSIVFIDDSPLELAEVQAAHPGVETLLFPKDQDQAVYDLLWRLRDLFGKTAVRGRPPAPRELAPCRRGARSGRSRRLPAHRRGGGRRLRQPGSRRTRERWSWSTKRTSST